MAELNAKQLIIRILREKYELACENHRTKVAEHAACIGAANAWDQYHSDDGIGGMCQNPYNVQRASDVEMQSRNHLSRMKEAYELAVDTFLHEPTREEVTI